jgi:3-dehydroquinate dehydratase/shikimate dehydrogenase
VVIGRTRHGMVQAEIQEAARRGARFIELRLDYLKKAPDFKRLLGNKGALQMVATVRRPPDGGKWDGSEEARLTLLRQAIIVGFDWVDLETDVADKVPRRGTVKRIVSYHNFREMPAELEKIHQRMCAQDADVVKIVVRAQQASDNLRVLKLLRNPARPTIAFCIGDIGFPSRILAGKFGAPFTYAAWNKERNIAPGMPSFIEVKKIYHFDRINEFTQVFGVVGDPVGHSLGPLVHNRAFQLVGINAVYLPFRVPRETLPAFLHAFAEIPVRGYSVTIPHKEAAAVVAKKKAPAVERTQAANTLLKSDDGWIAHNTDYQGVIDTLETALATLVPQSAPQALPGPAPLSGVSPSGIAASGITTAPFFVPARPAPPPVPESAPGVVQSRVVLVLGAGGIARAVAHALHREGALVILANRTLERAQALANEIGCRHVEWNARHGVLCDMVVNCTSVGMHPNIDESPLHASFFKPGLIVFDTVYTPETTLLIKEARDRGCHVITGVELFVRQAALQFQLFTGQPAPVEYIRETVKKALSPIAIREE